MSPIEVVQSVGALQSLVCQWDQLQAPSPMQSPHWLLNWWQAFRMPGDQLNVVVIRDEAGQMIGLAPWYARRTFALGTTWRFLGDGAVCSDFQTVLTRPGCGRQVGRQLVPWLSSQQARWDLLDLEGCSASDPWMTEFHQAMALRGHMTHWRPTLSTWRIDLSAGWESFQHNFSRTQRSQLRNFMNRFDKGGYRFRLASRDAGNLDYYIAETIRLHQARWQAAGESGCFAPPAFRSFFEHAMRDMIIDGTAEIALLERDDRALAANAWLVSNRIGFGYQSGRDPSENANKVGRIMHAVCLRHYIEQGLLAFDFLRGNELYKSQWRAQPTACGRLRIVARARLPEFRHSIWATCREVKSLFSAEPATS